MATYWENSCPFVLRCVSWYTCLIVSLVFSHLGFWSGNLFLIAPFPDLCLLVPFCMPVHLNITVVVKSGSEMKLTCSLNHEVHIDLSHVKLKSNRRRVARRSSKIELKYF